MQRRWFGIAHAEIEISSDTSELARIRRFVREFCQGIPGPALDEDIINQLEIAVNEALTNIMRHAYHGRTDQRIQIEARASANRISISLCHWGETFSPEMVEPPAFDGSREGGFGVYIIDRCVDETIYSCDGHGKNCVCLVKNRKHTRMKET